LEDIVGCCTLACNFLRSPFEDPSMPWKDQSK